MYSPKYVDYVDKKRIESAFYNPKSKPKTWVGINHDNRKSLLSGLAVLLCSADYERVKRVFSPEHLEAAWEAGKQLRRSVNWEGNGKRVYLQVKLWYTSYNFFFFYFSPYYSYF